MNKKLAYGRKCPKGYNGCYKIIPKKRKVIVIYGLFKMPPLYWICPRCQAEVRDGVKTCPCCGEDRQ